MLTVTFVRHGETPSNVAKIIQTFTPGELTDRGVKMAESLGLHLANEKYSRIYSSDLKRCHDTTLHILKHSTHQQPEVVLDETLRERSYGDLEGQPYASANDIVQRQLELGLPPHSMPVPGGEPYEATKERTRKFFHVLCKLADATNILENVLLVTHGCWLMIFLDYLEENGDLFDLVNYDKKIRETGPHNTATTKLVIEKMENEEGKRNLRFLQLFNTNHLPHSLL